MKTIEIKTSYNVIIKLNLASVLERGVAYFIDMLIVWAAIGLLYASFSAFVFYNPYYLLLFIAAPILGCYTLLFEIFFYGQTIGKKIMKIQVVRIDGVRIRIADIFMRWIFRILDIYSTFSVLALLTITASPRGQRLGDLLADTCVIKINEKPDISLDAIVKLDELKDVEPTYPDVIKLTEPEMMIIKETIERVKKYPNDAHYDALDKLVERLENILQLKCKTDKIDFLKTLIKDYVILTR